MIIPVVGDTVEVLLDPAGPGTEEYRRSHGYRCNLRVESVNHHSRTFTGSFFVEDPEALCEWLEIMGWINDGVRIGERRSIDDLSFNVVEKRVESRRVTLAKKRFAEAASCLAEAQQFLAQADQAGDLEEVDYSNRLPSLDELPHLVANIHLVPRS